MTRAILVADDVPLNLQLLEGIFENTHHRLVFARNGREAIEQATKHHPDLILLDIRMPDMDGREAFTRLRANPEFSDVPIISVTASSMMAEELKLRREFDGYIRKPFSSTTLFKEIERLLPRDRRDGAEANESTVVATEKQKPAPAAAVGPEWPAMVAELRRIETEVWPQLSQTAAARETAAFAHLLIERGKSADCPTLIAYGEKLAGQVERFQISAVEASLRAFPQLVTGLADMLPPEARP